MGNRVNYGFKSGNDNDTLYLYLHNGPYEVREELAKVLYEVKSRWNHEAYATRRAIVLLLQNLDDGGDGETGSGLTVNHLSDNENEVLVVDFTEQTVSGNQKTWNLYEFVDQYRPESGGDKGVITRV